MTNGGQLFSSGDGRSRNARRLRDLIAELAAPYGGFEAADEATRQLVRRAATLSLQAETLDADMAAGKPVDPIAYSTVTNGLRRILETLSAKHAPVSPPGSPPKLGALEEHIAKRNAERAHES